MIGLISQEEHDHIVAIPAPPDIDDNHSQSKSLDISRTNHTDSDKQITSNENQSQISFENSKVVDSGQSHELPNSSKSRLSTDIIESQCVEYGSQGYLVCLKGNLLSFYLHMLVNIHIIVLLCTGGPECFSRSCWTTSTNSGKNVTEEISSKFGPHRIRQHLQ